jgi:hypothetical protein
MPKRRILHLIAIAGLLAGLVLTPAEGSAARQGAPADCATSHCVYLPLVFKALPDIGGIVTYRGSPLAGVVIGLYNTKGGLTLVKTSRTDAGGNYRFSNLAPLDPLGDYLAAYENAHNGNPDDGRFLAYLTGIRINYLSLSTFNGALLPGGDLDIDDLPLVSPSNAAVVTFPATFQWTPRAYQGSGYEVDFSDAQDKPCYYTPRLSWTNQAVLAQLPPGCGYAPLYYYWSVYVYDSNPSCLGCIGWSYWSRAVYFSVGVTQNRALPLAPRQNILEPKLQFRN